MCFEDQYNYGYMSEEHIKSKGVIFIDSILTKQTTIVHIHKLFEEKYFIMFHVLIYDIFFRGICYILTT